MTNKLRSQPISRWTQRATQNTAPLWHRRAFLKNLGLTGLALPWLRSLNPVWAQEKAPIDPPKRLILFYTPNGTKKELWRPSHAPGTIQQLGSVLTPLNALADKLVLFDGLDLKAAQEGPGGPHQRGMASLFTGSVISEGDFVGGDGRKAGWASSASLDQIVAQQIGADTPFRSIELGIRVKENMPRGRISYAGANQPIPPENNPLNVYERLFSGGGEPSELITRRLRRRSSALDSVFKNFEKLNQKVDRQDREKLQQHYQSVRELERRLSLLGERSDLCQATTPNPLGDVLQDNLFGHIAQQQVDLMVMALACDQTRVASLQCSTAVNALRFNFLEPMVSSEGHSLSHAGDSNAAMQENWERNLQWYSELFAYLLNRLNEVPEGNGTLLDHTIILWGNEISRGNTHDLNDIPFVLAGGAGMIPTGRYLKYESIPHNPLLLGIAQAFGVEQEELGTSHHNQGVLSQLFG